MLSILGAIFLVIIVLLCASIILPIMGAFLKLTFLVLWKVVIPVFVVFGVIFLLFAPYIAIGFLLVAFILWVVGNDSSCEGGA